MKRLLITVEGKQYEVLVETLDNSSSQQATPPAPTLPPPQPTAHSIPQSSTPHSKSIPSPLTGKVVAINVAPHQSVNQGEKLITLEAMKMNTFVTAPFPGKISTIKVSIGDTVTEGQCLIEVE